MSTKTKEFFEANQYGYMNVEGDSKLVIALRDHVDAQPKKRPFLLQKLSRDDFNLKPY